MDWLFSAHCCITCGHNYLEVIIRVHASIWSMIALTKVIVWKPIDAIFYFFLGCCQSLLETLLVMGMLKQKQIKLWMDQTHSITTRNMTWWAFCNITHVYWGKAQNKCFIQLHNSYDIEKWIHLLMLSFFKLHIMTLDNHLITQHWFSFWFVRLLYKHTSCFKKFGLPEFDIPKQVLQLVYGECLIW